MQQLLKFDRHSSSETYMDYVFHFSNDEDGIGGYFQVTLVNEKDQKPNAYVTMCINNEDGDELIEQEFDIDRETALKLIAVHHENGVSI